MARTVRLAWAATLLLLGLGVALALVALGGPGLELSGYFDGDSAQLGGFADGDDALAGRPDGPF